jgi:hypothetical protein
VPLPLLVLLLYHLGLLGFFQLRQVNGFLYLPFLLLTLLCDHEIALLVHLIFFLGDLQVYEFLLALKRRSKGYLLNLFFIPFLEVIDLSGTFLGLLNLLPCLHLFLFEKGYTISEELSVSFNPTFLS